MKALLNLIFLLILPSYIQAQSDRYIDKHTVQIELSTKIFLTDSTHNVKQIYCGEEEFFMFLGKKRILLWSKKYNLDLKVKKRKVGNTKSWVCENYNGDLYFVTAFNKDQFYGLIFQPVKSTLSPRYDISTYVICNKDICK